MKIILLLIIYYDCVFGCPEDPKSCKDGLCVYHSCPEEFCVNAKDCLSVKNCTQKEIYCSSDGSCVGENATCPCPSTKPNHCSRENQIDDRCYSKSERCNGVKDCSNGNDELSCIVVEERSYLNGLLYPVTIAIFVILAMCGLIFKIRRKRNHLNRRRIETLSWRVAQRGFNRRRQPGVYHDPPPPYPHDNPVDVISGETEAERTMGVTVTSAPPSEYKSNVLPPSYSEVLSGIYQQIIPGQASSKSTETLSNEL